MTAPPPYQWFTSSYSGGSGTECVQCAHTYPGILVRDSKCTGGPVLSIPTQAWQDFINALRGTP